MVERDFIQTRGLWLARGLIGVVLFFNVQCALVFLLWPNSYTASFELIGTPGRLMVQGMGLLFLMWNVPYAMAIMNPVLRKTSLFEAVIMQTIGVVGESLLLISLPMGHPVLRTTALRFIAFDGIGLFFLLCSVSLLALTLKNDRLSIGQK
jgi:hypothetical protein